MPFTTSYREKHKEIALKIEEIQELIRKYEMNAANEICSGLAKFSGIIKIHLAAEDNALYPKLANSEDPELQKMAKSFQDEMGSIKDVYIQFTKKYNTPEKIQASFAEFKNDFNRIVEALNNRIEREENELYALADKVLN